LVFKDLKIQDLKIWLSAFSRQQSASHIIGVG
jgi:hypothetical protein